MAWWKRAKPGDKVVCADVGCLAEIDPDNYDFTDELEEGRVYTIERIYLVPEDGEPMVELVEVYSPEDANHYAGFPAVEFRPVEPKSTASGFETIRKILDTVPVKEDA